MGELPSSQGVGFRYSLENIVQSEMKMSSNFKQWLYVQKENSFDLDVRPFSVSQRWGLGACGFVAVRVDSA